MSSIAITGCSSGFGRVTTLRFLRERWHVIATVRRDEDRTSLIDEARRLGAADHLTVVLADITRAEDVSRLRETVTSRAAPLTALVNNAGGAFPGLIELLPIEDLRAQLEINVVAQIAITQALLPHLRAARGTIINVSSVSGLIATPAIGAYTASKFALEALSDVLRMEVAPLGVRVVVIEPGSSPTRIWESGRARLLNQRTDHGPYAPLLSTLKQRAESTAGGGFPPELFADTVWKIVNTATPKTRYLIPKKKRRALIIHRLLPDRVMDWMIGRRLNWKA